MKKIDLHLHSTVSDGEMTPKEIIDFAVKKGIPAISITDHDRIRANKEAMEYSKDKSIEYVSGLEITCTPPKDVKEVHIVGLFINIHNKEIKNIYNRHREYTKDVVKKIITKLNYLGYEITFEELFKETGGKHLGRPWIAKLLMKKYPEEFKNRKEVFNKLLGKEGKAFEKSKGTSIKDAIGIIHQAGGIAILAHPWHIQEKMEEVVKKFVELGGDGIERNYIQKESIPKNMGKRLDDLILKFGLVVSGGTDFHNFNKGEEIGDRGITKEEFEKLKNLSDYNQKLFKII